MNDPRELPARPRIEPYLKQAKGLIADFRGGHPDALQRLRQFHPALPGRADTNDRNAVSDAVIQSAGLTLDQAKEIIAKEHQFNNWRKFSEHIRALNVKEHPVARFEAAVTAIVHGKETILRRLLKQHSELIRARSTREHQATLLHYVSANAVESYRQRTPKNAVKIARILLEAGAEVDADLDYGSETRLYPERKGSTPLGLAATSYHPAAAGVQIPLMDLLLKHGACVNGLKGGWNPLIAALHNGRGEAAVHLARRGAEMDLEGAAGAGRLDRVKEFFDKRGNLKGATRKQMELGFLWSCEYGHPKVAQFLLEQGLKPGTHDQRETGLHWACYTGRAQVVKILLKWKAPLEVKDERFASTPLEWALYGWWDQPLGGDSDGYYEIVSRLIKAGAVFHESWITERKLIAKKLRSDRRMQTALKGG